MALIGYARVSTADQDLAAQRQALAAAGCALIVEETASGADAGPPGRAAGKSRTGARASASSAPSPAAG